MKLIIVLKTTAAYCAALAVMNSIKLMVQHFGDYYYPELAEIVEYIFKDKFVCIIKEQCSDQEESKWKR